MKISTVKSYLIISIGTFMMALGIYFFEFPNGFSTGGVSGIAIILSRVIDGLSPTKIATILNFLLILVGLVVLGKKFAFKTVFTTGLLSLFLNLFENLLPLKSPITHQKLLELFIDMILISLGAALIFNEEASSGGTDIIALIIKKFFNVKIGKALLVVDGFVILGAFLLLGVEIGFFSLFALVIRALVVDSAIESLKGTKFFIIITNDHTKIVDFITRNLDRGATILNGCEGAYEKCSKKAIVSVVEKKQAVVLKHKIKELDPNAFTIIGTSSDIIGNGFSSL